MAFALEHRQAIHVRTQSALKEGIAIIEQMLRRDRRTHADSIVAHQGSTLLRRDMLHDHAQGRQPREQGGEHLFGKARLTIENIDVGPRHLAMGQKRDGVFGHGFEHRHDVVD